MSSKRYEPNVRREMILKAALRLASTRGGWCSLTREGIAREAGCSDGLVSRYLGTMKRARKHIMKAAIKEERTEIIVQSIAAHDGFAIKERLPESLRQKAIASLLG